jgi:hypothetical protein
MATTCSCSTNSRKAIGRPCMRGARMCHRPSRTSIRQAHVSAPGAPSAAGACPASSRIASRARCRRERRGSISGGARSSGVRSRGVWISRWRGGLQRPGAQAIPLARLLDELQVVCARGGRRAGVNTLGSGTRLCPNLIVRCGYRRSVARCPGSRMTGALWCRRWHTINPYPTIT